MVCDHLLYELSSFEGAGHLLFSLLYLSVLHRSRCLKKKKDILAKIVVET